MSNDKMCLQMQLGLIKKKLLKKKIDTQSRVVAVSFLTEGC